LVTDSVEVSIRDGRDFSETAQLGKLLAELRAKRDEVIAASQGFEEKIKDDPDFKRSVELRDKENQEKAIAFSTVLGGLWWSFVGAMIVFRPREDRP